MQKRFTLGKCLTFFDLFFRQEERVFATYFGHAGYFDNGYVSAKITTSRLWRGSADLQRNTELLMFFCICFIVCLHKSCDYISIGEITNIESQMYFTFKTLFWVSVFFCRLMRIHPVYYQKLQHPFTRVFKLMRIKSFKFPPASPGPNYIQIPLLILKDSLRDQRML